MGDALLGEKLRDLNKGSCTHIMEFIAEIQVILNFTVPTIHHLLCKMQVSHSLKDNKNVGKSPNSSDVFLFIGFLRDL